MILIITGTVAYAQEWVESYDPNTEIAIKGKIAEIIQRDKGPVVIGVIKHDKIYHVITAPRWYVEQEKIEFNLGDEVVVHGAKFFSKKGELFIIARSIHNILTGKIYSFRDEHMKPCWRGGNQHGKKYWKFIPQ
uniref:Magnetosome protein MamS/MamX domain-containing protein n=1 Tax=Thermodesulfovibrio aggregans TaxID=86166 RepID=A0A7C4ELX5_9BACT